MCDVTCATAWFRFDNHKEHDQINSLRSFAHENTTPLRQLLYGLIEHVIKDGK